MLVRVGGWFCWHAFPDEGGEARVFAHDVRCTVQNRLVWDSLMHYALCSFFCFFQMSVY